MIAVLAAARRGRGGAGARRCARAAPRAAAAPPRPPPPRRASPRSAPRPSGRSRSRSSGPRSPSPGSSGPADGPAQGARPRGSSPRSPTATSTGGWRSASSPTLRSRAAGRGRSGRTGCASGRSTRRCGTRTRCTSRPPPSWGSSGSRRWRCSSAGSSRWRGGHREAAGAIAALVAYAVHAGLDWDWEMPALTLVALVLAARLQPQQRALHQPPAERREQDRAREPEDGPQHVRVDRALPLGQPPARQEGEHEQVVEVDPVGDLAEPHQRPRAQRPRPRDARDQHAHRDRAVGDVPDEPFRVGVGVQPGVPQQHDRQHVQRDGAQSPRPRRPRSARRAPPAARRPCPARTSRGSPEARSAPARAARPCRRTSPARRRCRPRSPRTAPRAATASASAPPRAPTRAGRRRRRPRRTASTPVPAPGPRCRRRRPARSRRTAARRPHLVQRQHQRGDRQRHPVGRHDPQRPPPRVGAQPHAAAQERPVEQEPGEQEEDRHADVHPPHPRPDRRVRRRRRAPRSRRRGSRAPRARRSPARRRARGARLTPAATRRARRRSASSATSETIQPIRQLSGWYVNSTMCVPGGTTTPRKR